LKACKSQQDAAYHHFRPTSEFLKLRETAVSAKGEVPQHVAVSIATSKVAENLLAAIAAKECTYMCGLCTVQICQVMIPASPVACQKQGIQNGSSIRAGSHRLLPGCSQVNALSAFSSNLHKHQSKYIQWFLFACLVVHRLEVIICSQTSQVLAVDQDAMQVNSGSKQKFSRLYTDHPHAPVSSPKVCTSLGISFSWCPTAVPGSTRLSASLASHSSIYPCNQPKAHKLVSPGFRCVLACCMSLALGLSPLVNSCKLVFVAIAG